MLNPAHCSDYHRWEIGLSLLDAMDINLAAAKQVLTLTEEGLRSNLTEHAENVVWLAQLELNKAAIANAAAHRHYKVGVSHESVDQIDLLDKEVREQAERLPDHLEGRAVRDNDPISGRRRQAFLVVESSRMIHERAALAIELIRQDDGPRNTKTMLQAIIWQAVLAVEHTGSATRDLTRLQP